MAFDLAIVETNNGGDLVLLKSDLAVVSNFENEFYLRLFGGNVAQSTTSTQTNNNLDWWGNNLLIKANPDLQFNSQTERVLLKTELTSKGRVLIENAIREDLQGMNIISLSVVITATDRLEINIQLATDDFEDPINIFISIQITEGGSFNISDFDLSFD